MLTSTPMLLDGRCLFVYEYLLSGGVFSLRLCRLSLVVFVRTHVYKRPTLRQRDSKRVLFCTNTSRRRTCPDPHLVNPASRELPYLELSKSRTTVLQL